jgi:uncharacterized protein (DUF608 family)
MSKTSAEKEATSQKSTCSNGCEELERRDFLKLAALSALAGIPVKADAAGPLSAGQNENSGQNTSKSPSAMVGHASSIEFPRIFRGNKLKMIAYPLGGVGAGSIGLGGRGNLRDWEIANRPDKGNAPAYAFASIRVSGYDGKSSARIIESAIEAPFEGPSGLGDGLGSRSAPGLPRFADATFRGEFPKAHIDFHDETFPVLVSLDAGTPFIPLDADASGLPCAELTYTVHNPTPHSIDVSIAFSLENPIIAIASDGNKSSEWLNDGRVNEVRSSTPLNAIFFRNSRLSTDSEDSGTFALGAIAEGADNVTVLRGWPSGGFSNSVLFFWDDFCSDGQLGPESPSVSAVGSICVKRTIPPGNKATYTFLLGWHYPNRTPGRCGWDAPEGLEHKTIGNWYSTRYSDAWEALQYTAANLTKLQERSEKFCSAMRETTLPDVVKEAATTNISTLTRQTCFRTADGNFYAFEGCEDRMGSCPGNSTSVFNYQVAIEHLFPTFSRSMRESAFGPASDERGCMDLRQLLPAGVSHRSYAAADGQMAQAMKIYLDWQISGDTDWLRAIWPRVKRCISFAWVPGGWDANKDGVMEGVQNNTYDTEFVGPNPLCGLWYLGALRAGQEMAKVLGDTTAESEYRELFTHGSTWIDQNLFDGRYFVQRIGSVKSDNVAKGLRSYMSVPETEHPDSQMGEGCLIDQLVGQYMSTLCDLGYLVNPDHVRTTLHSIWALNHKNSLRNWECFARTFALNDEGAIVICDYPPGTRPKLPFPYFSEVMTGFEYSAATLMIAEGMVSEGLQAITDIRNRYDGVKRNPWDESEAGHHYVRAMAAWSAFLMLSGFRCVAPEKRVVAAPLWKELPFRSFWSSGRGWGMLSLDTSEMTLAVHEGSISISEVEFIASRTSSSSVSLAGRALEHRIRQKLDRVVVNLSDPITISADQALVLKV